MTLDASKFADAPQVDKSEEFTSSDEIAKRFIGEIVGKTILITGASPGGIGAASALSLALGSPKQLIVAGRSPEKLAATISEVKAVNPSVEVTPLELDLLSLKQVDRAAKALLEKVPVIDILINNAGIMAPPYELSEDGIESQFAVNHLAHFHLTRVLLPALQRSPGRGRVINVSSAGHRLGPVRLDDWNFSDGKTYDKWEGYGQSKSANVLFSVALKKRGDVGEAFAIHPGTVSTHLLKEHAKADIESTFAQAEAAGMPFKFKTPKQGASTVLRAALDPTLKEFAYLEDCQISQAAAHAVDPEIADKLWKLSEEIIDSKLNA